MVSIYAQKFRKKKQTNSAVGEDTAFCIVLALGFQVDRKQRLVQEVLIGAFDEDGRDVVDRQSLESEAEHAVVLHFLPGKYEIR